MFIICNSFRFTITRLSVSKNGDIRPMWTHKLQEPIDLYVFYAIIQVDKIIKITVKCSDSVINYDLTKTGKLLRSHRISTIYDVGNYYTDFDQAIKEKYGPESWIQESSICEQNWDGKMILLGDLFKQSITTTSRTIGIVAYDPIQKVIKACWNNCDGFYFSNIINGKIICQQSSRYPIYRMLDFP